VTGPRILLTISRTWTQWSTVRRVLTTVHGRYPDAVLVHGDHPRCDRVAAGMWRQLGGVDDPWPADWKRYGKSAGPRRNARMVESNPALCLAFIRGASPGATGTADLAEGAGIHTVRYEHQEVA
jgi:hypothetical protein